MGEKNLGLPTVTPDLLPLSEVFFGFIRVGENEVRVDAQYVMDKGCDWAVSEVLGQRAPFQSMEALRKFVANTPGLEQLANGLPEDNNPKWRLNLAYAYFKRIELADGRNSAEVFLRSLAKLETLAPKDD